MVARMRCNTNSRNGNNRGPSAPCFPLRARSMRHRQPAWAALDPAEWTGTEPADLAYAADLVSTVARIIPAPGVALCVDDDAWSAFDGLVSDAADLVAESLGHHRADALRNLLSSAAEIDPVRQMLIQRALVLLTDDERSR